MSKLRCGSALVVVVLNAIGIAAAQAGTTCDVTFSLATPETLEVLDVFVDYSALEGTFVGSQGRVQCSSTLPDTGFMVVDSCSLSDNYCYSGSGRVLHFILTRSGGFEGNGDIVSCEFVAPLNRKPVIEDFRVEVRSALLLSNDMENSRPTTVDISKVVCAE
jgi:hypothetical protein